MTRQRYSIKEALNRLLRSFQGKSLTDDTPGALTGEILSENEVWSDMAELFQGSLPGETLFFPDNMSTRHGQIYSAYPTGTSQALVTGTWAALTGFSGDGLYSPRVTPDYTNGRIILYDPGVYFLTYKISLDAAAGSAITFRASPAVNGVRQDSLVSKRSVIPTIIGDLGTSGFINTGVVPASGTYVNILVLDETSNRVVQIYGMQLTVMKIGKV